MIDALFGSKTRVKLLHLFMNNPGKSFYVREITRLIDEQINSVRRELSNMMNAGVVVSSSKDNKLYYMVNNKYDHYEALCSIFADNKTTKGRLKQSSKSGTIDGLTREVQSLQSIKLAVLSGVFVSGSGSQIDLLLVGSPTKKKVKELIDILESHEGREINYSVLSYDEFYYRLSIRDRFITELVGGRHVILDDKEGVLSDSK
ncbi:transcriptional regulator [Candidatus Nomurabacteria bacterium]|nr:transcriptional regulator [Candidatus Nomurabacteria bacterium]